MIYLFKIFTLRKVFSRNLLSYLQSTCIFTSTRKIIYILRNENNPSIVDSLCSGLYQNRGSNFYWISNLNKWLWQIRIAINDAVLSDYSSRKGCKIYNKSWLRFRTGRATLQKTGETQRFHLLGVLCKPWDLLIKFSLSSILKIIFCLL